MASTSRDFQTTRERSQPKGAGEQTRAKTSLPILAKITFVTLIIPAIFNIGSIALTPSKILLLGAVPVLLIRLFRGDYGKMVVPDFMVLLFCFWMSLSVTINHPTLAIQFVGSNTIILLGGYLVARATIRDRYTAEAFSRFFAAVVIFSLPFALYESATGHATIPTWLNKLPGIRSFDDAYHEPRMGLWRTQWAFAHPIHYGLFCSMAFSLYFVGLQDTVRFFKRMFVSGTVAFCCFLSVSSGPFFAMIVQLALISYRKGTGWMKSRWTALWTTIFVLYIPLELLSTNALVYAIAERASFTPQTAYARKVIFEHGTAQIGKTPVFGNGFNEWDLPDYLHGSVDNFWLLLALQFGIPAFAFMMTATVWGLFSAGKRDFSKDKFVNTWRRGWIFTMVSIIISLATVAVWAELYTVTMFMIGSGMWMIHEPGINDEEQQTGEPNEKAPDSRFKFAQKKRVDLPKGSDGYPFTRFPKS